MGDNVFAEPGDEDRTIIRPVPGGARGTARPVASRPANEAPPPTPSPPAPLAIGPDLEVVSAGDGPLALAAAPLLLLLGRLRNTATAPAPGDVLERTKRELQAFDRRGRALGVPADQLRQAHYALCAALDDAVLNTPWGRDGRWREEPLSRSLHRDDNAGRGFFDQLRSLRDLLPASLPVLELMFVCVSLGMAGPYRTSPDGSVQLDRIRHHVFELISKHSAPLPAALAPNATGIDARFMPARSGFPVWVAAAAALGVLAATYVWFLSGLNHASDAVYNAALTAQSSAMPALAQPPAPPPPPAPVVAGPADALRSALADLSDIQVSGGPASTILRIPARSLFPQSNATLDNAALVDRLAQALRSRKGLIQVYGYTDTRPPHSVKFPSSFALSTARAKALAEALGRVLPDPARITAEGRADADPIAPNTTADGRERNNRIEIMLPGLP